MKRERRRRREEEERREISLGQRSAKSQKEGERLLLSVWLLFGAPPSLLSQPWQGAQKRGGDQGSQKRRRSTIQGGSQKGRAQKREERPWKGEEGRGGEREGKGGSRPPSRLRSEGERSLLHGEPAKKRRERERSEERPQAKSLSIA